jgi:hypothetical protein
VWLWCSTRLWRLHKAVENKGQSFELQEVKAPRISTQQAHEGGKFVSPMHWPPLPPRDIPGTHFCWSMSQPWAHSAAGRIKSIQNPNDPTQNQIHDIPVGREC